LTGELPAKIFYGSNDPATEEMKVSLAVQRRREEYIQQGCPASASLASSHFEAYFDSFVPKGLNAGNFGVGIIPIMNQTQFQVGGHSGSIKKAGGIVNYTVTNTAGFSSFIGRSAFANTFPVFGLQANAWDNPFGPQGKMHNVDQIFQWSETDPCQK